MDWRDWMGVVTVVAFAQGQVGHAVTDPLGCKKIYHAEPTGIYRVTSLTGSHAVVGSGTLSTTITPATGTIVATSRSGAAPTVQST